MKHLNMSFGIVVLDERILFLQRSETQTLMRYLWQLPGGKEEPDETPLETLVREFREELEQEIVRAQLLRIYDNTGSIPGDPRQIQVTLYLYRVVTGPGEIRLSHEHRAYGWYGLSYVLSNPGCFLPQTDKYIVL